MKRLIFAGLICAAALVTTHASAVNAQQPFPKQCIAVTCLPCPEGTVAAPKPNDCCRCV